ncbi:helix-turn-helix domain-containing protein [Oceanobacillus caeni]
MELDGKMLKKMRLRKGWSQDELGDRLHMSYSNISRIENDKLSIRGKDLINWVRQTDSQDLLIALVMNIDVVSAAEMVLHLTGVATILFLGGIL